MFNLAEILACLAVFREYQAWKMQFLAKKALKLHFLMGFTFILLDIR